MTAPVSSPPAVSFAQRPMLVFWETTRSCQLACRHCRASALPQPLPGELSRAQGSDLIAQVAGFGRPYPILVFTGGDCLLRPDLFDLVEEGVSRGVRVCLSPSVTPLLTREMIGRIAGSGVKAVSISLDGANPATHDGVRGIPGHFDATMQCIRAFVDTGLTVQVNTTVMRANVNELADVAACVAQSGTHIWEVFFLVQMGRGEAVAALTPEEHEDVCHFLYDASQYGFVVRTVEAPFFRRVVAFRNIGVPAPEHTLYRKLLLRLTQQLGDASERKRVHTAATRDGKGILFVAYDGDVYPAGFLPVPLGNIRDQPLVGIYRDDPLLRSIRAARFANRCGRCEYADLCGGSRARAYAASGDPLGEDPACPYQPGPQSARPCVTGPVPMSRSDSL